MPSKESIIPKTTEKKWVAYILRCHDTSLYTGITNDIDNRLKKHQNGTASRYTRSRLPVKLVYIEQCDSHSIALKREYAIKKLSRADKYVLVLSGSNKISR